MSWGNGRVAARLLAVVVLGALTAGCFQPMYAERTVTGEPALREKLSAVDVSDIATVQPADARLGVELRNGLIFSFTGGGSPAPPTHKLVVRMSTTRTTARTGRLVIFGAPANQGPAAGCRPRDG